MRHLLKCFGSCMTVVHSWLAIEVRVLLMDVHIRTADIISAIINWWSCTFYLFFHVVKPTRSITKSYNSTIIVILNVKVFSVFIFWTCCYLFFSSALVVRFLTRRFIWEYDPTLGKATRYLVILLPPVLTLLLPLSLFLCPTAAVTTTATE